MGGALTGESENSSMTFLQGRILGGGGILLAKSANNKAEHDNVIGHHCKNKTFLPSVKINESNFSISYFS